ncbi:hypothetical protein IEU95_02560 [Hoyosella rhizosphaerae]|uniref:Uncharacterized protein n=1 Tax=Hoyosella rhizosphaerae TaxID=1755582 RepID=A0A916XEY7_9ACTN|nr:hypothetical protein [Hoyosella rhizosphaerae]MBN4925698.1 hypothetical protein [Hoyosella rhizosphaerae]GGC68630.1 hypothetical protein GCM10011410_21740 [Hoyosella rhizosphaerae]
MLVNRARRTTVAAIAAGALTCSIFAGTATATPTGGSVVDGMQSTHPVSHGNGNSEGNGNQNRLGGGQVDEQWLPAAYWAAQGIYWAARAAGPVVFRAMASAVRAGYNSFASWCGRHQYICGVGSGVTAAEIHHHLRNMV